MSAAFEPRPLPASHPRLVACAECDAVHARVVLAPAEIARCRRCDAPLERGHRLSIEGQLALTLAALATFVIANLSNIVTLQLRGLRSPVSLLEAVGATWDAGEKLVALLAAATAFAFPLLVIAMRLFLLVPAAQGSLAPRFRLSMVILDAVSRWSMVEVFLLATLIAVVRSAGLASVIVGPGLVAFVALTLLLAAVDAAGLQVLWSRLPEATR